MRSWLLASGGVVGAALISMAACGGGDTNAGSGGAAGGTQNTGGMASSSTGSTGGAGGGTGGASTGGGGSGTGGMFVPMCIDTPNDTVFALDHLAFGNSSANAWKSIGFDIDGITSAGSCTGQCVIDTADGAKASVQCQDGNNGIDNSFGQTLVPFFAGFNVNLDDQANAGLTTGTFTLMLDLVGLTTDTEQGPLTMNVYGGANLDSMPKFDGTDCWPVTPDSLHDTSDITTPKTTFDNTMIANNHVTSGIINSLPLAFATSLGTIALNIHAARLEFDLSAGHDAVLNGVVGGVVDAAELTVAIQRVAWNQFHSALCHAGDTKIAQSVDILDDGTQGSGNCEAVSVGIDFTMKPVKFGGIAPGVPTKANMCPP